MEKADKFGAIPALEHRPGSRAEAYLPSGLVGGSEINPLFEYERLKDIDRLVISPQPLEALPQAATATARALARLGFSAMRRRMLWLLGTGHRLHAPIYAFASRPHLPVRRLGVGEH